MSQTNIYNSSYNQQIYPLSSSEPNNYYSNFNHNANLNEYNSQKPGFNKFESSQMHLTSKGYFFY